MNEEESSSDNSFKLLFSQNIQVKQMNDIIGVISQYLDDTTLETLHLIGVDYNLKQLSFNQKWWFERTRVLSQASISFSDLYSWKQAYIILKRCLANKKKGISNIRGREEDNPLVVTTLLDMGFPTPSCIISRCVTLDLPLILKTLLDDDRVFVILDDVMPFTRAIEQGKLEVFKILLAHPRATTYSSMLSGVLLQKAVAHLRIEEEEHPEDIVRVLLDDKRTNMNYYDNSALLIAIKNRHASVTRLILTHQRMDTSSVDMRLVITALIEGRSCTNAAAFLERTPELYQLLQKKIADK